MPFLVPALAAIGGGSALAGGIMAGTAAAGIGASIYGANKASGAAKTAAAQARDAAADNNALTKSIYDQNSATLAPFIASGTQAGNQINTLLQSNPYITSTGAQFQQDPGYDFARNEALRAINYGAGAAGQISSGGRLKALQERATGLANQQYSQWWGRDQADLANRNNATTNYLNVLGNQQGVGVSAAGAQAGVGTNYVNTISANNNNAASAAGNAALLGAQNTNSLLTGLAGAAGQYFGGGGGFGNMGRGSSYGTGPVTTAGFGYGMPGAGGYTTPGYLGPMGGLY